MDKPEVLFDSCGPSGNIYYILALVSKELTVLSRAQDYEKCRDRVYASGSYADALAVIREYVDLVDMSGCF